MANPREHFLLSQLRIAERIPEKGGLPGDWSPFDPEESEAQIKALLRLLFPPPKAVIDLGCGNGRTLIPLLEAGHHVIGIDRDQRALDEIEKILARRAAPARNVHLRRADFLSIDPDELDPQSHHRFDAVLCLGNTLMGIQTPDDLARFFVHAASFLKPGSCLIIDDFPVSLREEIESGNWQTGISEDGASQMIIMDDDPPGMDQRDADVRFVLREGGEVDEEYWAVKPADRIYCLWSIETLARWAGSSGLSALDQVTRADDISPAPLLQFRAELDC